MKNEMYCINRRTNTETTETDDSSEQKATQLEVLSLIEYFQQMLIIRTNQQRDERLSKERKMYVQHERNRTEQILTREGQNRRIFGRSVDTMECVLTAIE